MATVFQTANLTNTALTITNGDHAIVVEGVSIFNTTSRGATTTGGVGLTKLTNYGTILSGHNLEAVFLGADANRVINHGTISFTNNNQNGTAILLSGGDSTDTDPRMQYFYNGGLIESQGRLFDTFSNEGDFDLHIVNTGRMISHNGADGDIIRRDTDLVDAVFVNSGLVSGGALTLAGTGSTRIENTGRMVVRLIEGDADGGLDLFNTGTITGHGGADTDINMLEASLHIADKVVNSGLIRGDLNFSNGNDTLVNSGTITGQVLLGSGDDTFDGRGGKVKYAIYGNGGNDTYIVDNTRDTIVEYFGGGTDLVKAWTSFALPDEVENLTLMGIDNFNGYGNTLANTMIGNAGNNRLSGHDGNDTIRGGAGDDKLRGQDQNDTLEGGAGDDTLLGGKHNDRLEGGNGDDVLKGGHGNDTMLGGYGDDTLLGGAGKDRLFAQSGTDILKGGGGDDLFVFSNGMGANTILDFDALSNREDISLAAVSAITDWTDLRTNHMTQKGSDVLIDAGGGDTILLKDVALSDLHSGDFQF